MVEYCSRYGKINHQSSADTSGLSGQLNLRSYFISYLFGFELSVFGNERKLNLTFYTEKHSSHFQTCQVQNSILKIKGETEIFAINRTKESVALV